MKNARLRDCPMIVEYMDSRTAAIVAAEVGIDFTEEEQKAIVDFFRILTDEQLAYVVKYAFLCRVPITAMLIADELMSRQIVK